MKTLFILFLSLISYVSIYSQSILWTKTYGTGGSEAAESMVYTKDGSLVIAGYDDFGVLLMKVDQQGNQIWSKSFNLDNNGIGTVARDLKQTFDGGFIITGRTIGEVAFLIKTDSAGNKEWENTYHYEVGEDDRGHSVWQTSDSGYIVAGQTWIMNGPFGSYDMLLFKTDKDGNTQWMKIFSYSDSFADVALGVVPTSDGGYIMAGFTQNAAWAAFLIRTDANGNEIWRRIYEGPWQSEAYDIKPLPDGNFIITGTETSFETDTDVLLIKIDGLGNVIWKKVYGDEESEFTESVQVLNDGFLLTGMTTRGPDSWNMLVMRTDLNGDSLFTEVIGGEGDDRGHTGVKTADGIIYAAGHTWSFGAGLGDVYLVKISDKTQSVGINGNFTELSGYSLSQNYPNPFNPETKISFNLPKSAKAVLRIFDTSGKIVSELVNANLPAGLHSFNFNGANLTTGTYFYILEADGFREAKKMLLIK